AADRTRAARLVPSRAFGASGGVVPYRPGGSGAQRRRARASAQPARGLPPPFSSATAGAGGGGADDSSALREWFELGGAQAGGALPGEAPNEPPGGAREAVPRVT